MRINQKDIEYKTLKPPMVRLPEPPADLSGTEFENRLRVLCEVLAEEKLDAMVIYADREHGSNFGYFTGFEPRFEEGLLVIQQNGNAAVMLGNETLKMHQYSRIPVKPVHVPYFSLPNQPMAGETTMEEALKAAGLKQGMHIGVAGWKIFTGKLSDGRRMFDVPHFIVEAMENLGCGIENRADLLMGPERGIRTIHTAEEIVQLEYCASLASACVYAVLEQLEPGKTERELASNLAIFGQPLSCYSMCATGERFTNAVVFPRNKAVTVGDKFTVSMGLRGGLTCRAGYAARTPEELPQAVRDYVDALAKPYFAASASWYSAVKPGVTGGEVYSAVYGVLPKEIYGWQLNPGHLTATEEWLCSPVEKDSKIMLKSGMILQMDIIPKLAPYGGINAEDGVALADEALRKELAEKFPEVWARFQRRRDYMTRVLGIELDASVLPMSDTVGYLRPLLLAKGKALCVNREN